MKFNILNNIKYNFEIERLKISEITNAYTYTQTKIIIDIANVIFIFEFQTIIIFFHIL